MTSDARTMAAKIAASIRKMEEWEEKDDLSVVDQLILKSLYLCDVVEQLLTETEVSR